jgi:hypothetical protein
MNIERVRRAWIALAALTVALSSARPATATAISVGARIDITPTSFAVPIEIADALDVVSWTFDLTYDPEDVLVNDTCDPFAGDVYCSLLTGPVTEGDFFSSGAPFNLLNPGFIELDPATFEQTGLLFGVNGAFGGSTPFPSGSGTLAFVEFLIIGTGTSPIDVTGSVTSVVPEPGTLLLLTTGLLLPRARRLIERASRFSTTGTMALLTFALIPGALHAQTTANGPYFATPSWAQKLQCDTQTSCPRFIVLANWDGEAVLDRETWLVSERHPLYFNLIIAPFDSGTRNWFEAVDHCAASRIGNRYGWRLPTIQELASLLDHTGSDFTFTLSPGHPFGLIFQTGETGYWSRTIREER